MHASTLATVISEFTKIMTLNQPLNSIQFFCIRLLPLRQKDAEAIIRVYSFRVTLRNSGMRIHWLGSNELLTKYYILIILLVITHILNICKSLRLWKGECLLQL